MAKSKQQFQCQACHLIMSKWVGQCPECQTWGQVEAIQGQSYAGYAQNSDVQKLRDIVAEKRHDRLSTGLAEFDRVLGGGLVIGSGVLLGGDPGIGKSTVLLQTLGALQKTKQCLYVSGEESAMQIADRARRLGLADPECYVMSETDVMQVMAAIDKHKPGIVIIDSIQTMCDPAVASAPGSVTQIRECTQRLLQYGKKHHVTFLIVGHVTKEGQLAGPRVLEHMVDTVLYFEGDRSSRFRLIRAVKNRYGPAHELGVFVMESCGLVEVKNPSAMFLERHIHAPGRVVTALWEGSRSVLAEVQALVTTSYSDFPKRVTVGFEHQRMTLLVAILSRYLKVRVHEMDIFINLVGGIKVQETAADCALICAVWSSIHDIVLPSDLLILGEVGLSGELRAIPEINARISEAKKQGFNTIVHASRHQLKKTGIQSIGIDSIQQLPSVIKKLMSKAIKES